MVYEKHNIQQPDNIQLPFNGGGVRNEIKNGVTFTAATPIVKVQSTYHKYTIMTTNNNRYFAIIFPSALLAVALVLILFMFSGCTKTKIAHQAKGDFTKISIKSNCRLMPALGNLLFLFT